MDERIGGWTEHLGPTTDCQPKVGLSGVTVPQFQQTGGEVGSRQRNTDGHATRRIIDEFFGYFCQRRCRHWRFGNAAAAHGQRHAGTGQLILRQPPQPQLLFGVRSLTLCVRGG